MFRIKLAGLLAFLTLGTAYAGKGHSVATCLEKIDTPNYQTLARVASAEFLPEEQRCQRIVDYLRMRTSVSIRRQTLTSLEPFLMFPGIQRLIVAGNQITDLDDVARITGLRLLDLSKNPIQSLGSLPSMQQLENLRMVDVGMGSLDFLQDMRGLKSLAVGYNAITDLKPIAQLSLERLSIPGNKITDVSVLLTMPTLKLVHLGSNHICGTPGLASLDQLETKGVLVTGMDTQICDQEIAEPEPGSEPTEDREPSETLSGS